MAKKKQQSKPEALFVEFCQSPPGPVGRVGGDELHCASAGESRASCSEDSSLPSHGLGSAVVAVGRVGGDELHCSSGQRNASGSENSSLLSDRLGSARKVSEDSDGIGVSRLQSPPLCTLAADIRSWTSLNSSAVILPNAHKHIAERTDNTATVGVVYFKEGRNATSILPSSFPNTAVKPAILDAMPLPEISRYQHTWATLWKRPEPVILTVSKRIKKVVVVANGSKSKPVANSNSPTKHNGKRLCFGNRIPNQREIREYTQVPGRWIRSHTKSSGFSCHPQFLVSSHPLLLVCCQHELSLNPASVSSHDFILHIWITKPVCWAKSFSEEATVDAPNFVARNPVMTVTTRLNRQHLDTFISSVFWGTPCTTLIRSLLVAKVLCSRFSGLPHHKWKQQPALSGRVWMWSFDLNWQWLQMNLDPCYGSVSVWITEWMPLDPSSCDTFVLHNPARHNIGPVVMFLASAWSHDPQLNIWELGLTGYLEPLMFIPFLGELKKSIFWVFLNRFILYVSLCWFAVSTHCVLGEVTVAIKWSLGWIQIAS